MNSNNTVLIAILLALLQAQNPSATQVQLQAEAATLISSAQTLTASDN